MLKAVINLSIRSIRHIHGGGHEHCDKVVQWVRLEVGQSAPTSLRIDVRFAMFGSPAGHHRRFGEEHASTA
jgi:hypothetical protein